MNLFRNLGQRSITNSKRTSFWMT